MKKSSWICPGDILYAKKARNIVGPQMGLVLSVVDASFDAQLDVSDDQKWEKYTVTLLQFDGKVVSTAVFRDQDVSGYGVMKL